MPIEDGYDAGKYYYYLGVTSRKASNNDVVQTNHPVTFTVEKATFTIKPEDKERTKIYDGNPLAIQALSSVKEGSIVLYSLDCRIWKQDQPYITDAGVLNVKAKVEHPNRKTVTIDYTLEIIPRKVTLTRATTKKQYDGKLLTNKTVVVSGEGFVSKEGTTYKVTGTITDVALSKIHSYIHSIKAQRKRTIKLQLYKAHSQSQRETKQLIHQIKAIHYSMAVYCWLQIWLSKCNSA